MEAALPHPRAFACDFGIDYDPKLWNLVPGYLSAPGFLSHVLNLWGPLPATACCLPSLCEKALHGCNLVDHSEEGLSSKTIMAALDSTSAVRVFV